MSRYDYYGVYTACRDAAWQCMLDFNLNTLPVKLLTATKAAGIRVVRNSYINELKPGEQGASIFARGQWYIVYDDSLSFEESRAVLAHELGHILLGHDYKYAARRFDTENRKLKSEREADMFAIRLLAPACVLHELGATDASQIAELCGIPMDMASMRSQRMKVLEARGQFYKSKLEQQVSQSFSDFINNALASDQFGVNRKIMPKISP